MGGPPPVSRARWITYRLVTVILAFYAVLLVAGDILSWLFCTRPILCGAGAYVVVAYAAGHLLGVYILYRIAKWLLITRALKKAQAGD